ncbi:hypothetical protein KXS11_08870 [Plantibacter flavus]|uniref:hypothetical protein n=1 Tax=Plantibacter flavus TaxID=150123 RepID=UPI003F17447E
MNLIETLWTNYIAWASTWTESWLKDLLWPAVVVIALILFRKPISSFIDEISELGLWGASAKRRGDRAAEKLRERQEQNLTSEETDDSPSPSDLDEAGESNSEADATADTQSTAEETAPGAPETDDAHRQPAQLVEFIEFYRSISLLQLRGNRKNTASTTSTRVAREVVRSTYSDYLAVVRVIAFWIQGSSAVSGSRGRKANSHVTLQRIGAPSELIEATVTLRTFAVDVADGTVTLTGDGARSYVDTVDGAMVDLFTWAKQVAEERAAVTS